MSPNEAVKITDPDWKMTFICVNDGLPDLQKIVGADIDMRHLLHNQVQLHIDDVTVKLWQTRDKFDVEELYSLLNESALNFD